MKQNTFEERGWPDTLSSRLVGMGLCGLVLMSVALAAFGKESGGWDYDRVSGFPIVEWRYLAVDQTDAPLPAANVAPMAFWLARITVPKDYADHAAQPYLDEVDIGRYYRYHYTRVNIDGKRLEFEAKEVLPSGDDGGVFDRFRLVK